MQQSPSVDEQRLTGDERAVVGDEERKHPEEIGGLADATERRGGHVVWRRAPNPGAVLGGDEPGGQRVDPNLGRPQTADGACTNFLRINYGVLRQRVLKGGSDEEILDWCYTNGRRLNEGDLVVWNSFVNKLGWNDFASPVLEEGKQKHGITDRTDISTVADFIDFEEKRKS